MGDRCNTVPLAVSPWPPLTLRLPKQSRRPVKPAEVNHSIGVNGTGIYAPGCCFSQYCDEEISLVEGRRCLACVATCHPLCNSVSSCNAFLGTRRKPGHITAKKPPAGICVYGPHRLPTVARAAENPQRQMTVERTSDFPAAGERPASGSLEARKPTYGAGFFSNTRTARCHGLGQNFPAAKESTPSGQADRGTRAGPEIA